MPSKHPQQLIHEQSLPGRKGAALEATAGSTSRPPSAEEFWIDAAKGLDWFSPPDTAFGHSDSLGKETWFPRATLNICFEALDRHCLPTQENERPGARPCIHYVSSMPQASAKSKETLSYEEVLEKVKILAGVLRHTLGVKKGDRVIIYMAMVPECAIAMLACARIGAIHSVVFGGFAPRELAKRIDDARPKALLATSCGIEPKGPIDYKPLIDAAVGFSSHPPKYTLLLRRIHIAGHSPPPAPPPYHPNSLLTLTTLPPLSIANYRFPSKTHFFDWEQECLILPYTQRIEQCEVMRSEDVLYTLYTSGTTALPKGVVRLTAGYAVGLRYSMEHVFGMKSGETIFTASDLGWVVGHSYILYAPLLRGCATVIFEGKRRFHLAQIFHPKTQIFVAAVIPDAGIFWKIVEEYKVSALFTAPTALRAVQRDDPHATLIRKYNIRSLRSIFLAGERSEPNIIIKYQRLLDTLGAPGAIMNDNYWSTESGSPITAVALSPNFKPLRPRPGAAGMPLPGMDVRVVDDKGNELPRGEMGNVVLAPPLAPTALSTLWMNEEKYHEAYWKRFENHGWFDTGDAGMIDQDGYVHVLSRADDVMNVAGHRLSTSLLEQVISSHDLVAECCVVGKPDELKGHVPFALVRVASDETADDVPEDVLLKEINKRVREGWDFGLYISKQLMKGNAPDIGAIASLDGLVKGRLPKTRSGKTLRRTIRGIVEACAKGDYDATPKYPPTVEDVSAVEEANEIIREYFHRRNRIASAKL